MEHLTFLWHRGGDFHKDGTAIPLLFRAATVEDVKEFRGQHQTRRLWVKPGVSALLDCSILSLLASGQVAVGSVRMQWTIAHAASVGQAWGEELCGLHQAQHAHSECAMGSRRDSALHVKTLISMGCEAGLRRGHASRVQ